MLEDNRAADIQHTFTHHAHCFAYFYELARCTCLACVHSNLTCLAWSLMPVSQIHLHLLAGVVQVLHHAAGQLLGPRPVHDVA